MEDFKDYRVFKYDNYSKLGRSKLTYYTDQYSVANNEADFDTVKEALEKVGINITVEDVATAGNAPYRVTIAIDPDVYLAANMRFAGPKEKSFKFPDSKHGLANDHIYYSDIIFMLQTMSDVEIMNDLGIKYASYYRHKKKMMASEYYKNANKEKLGDIDYLKGEELAFYDEWF